MEWVTFFAILAIAWGVYRMASGPSEGSKDSPEDDFWDTAQSRQRMRAGAARASVAPTLAVHAPADARLSQRNSDVGPARRREPQKCVAAAKPPESAVLAVWEIDYRDIEFKDTTRRIHVTAVRPRLEQIEAWCELRQDIRIFWLIRIHRVKDVDSELEFDQFYWLGVYNRARRQKLGYREAAREATRALNSSC